MGWFESQIEQRRKNDDQLLEDSFVRIAGVVLGQRTAEKIGDARIITKSAIDEILKYYHVKTQPVPENTISSPQRSRTASGRRNSSITACGPTV